MQYSKLGNVSRYVRYKFKIIIVIKFNGLDTNISPSNTPL